LEEKNEKKASLQNRQICCWLKYNKGIVRYIEKKTDKELETEKKRKQNKYVYQQIKKKKPKRQSFYSSYICTGKRCTRASMCLNERPGVRCVHIYRRKNKEATVQIKRKIRKIKKSYFSPF